MPHTRRAVPDKSNRCGRRLKGRKSVVARFLETVGLVGSLREDSHRFEELLVAYGVRSSG